MRFEKYKTYFGKRSEAYSYSIPVFLVYPVIRQLSGLGLDNVKEGLEMGLSNKKELAIVTSSRMFS